MMKRWLALQVLFLLAATGLLAQYQYYQQGYIILNEQDTLKGFVERLRDIKLQEEVHFLARMDGMVPTVYKPFSIKGFWLPEEGSYFESAVFMPQIKDVTDTVRCFAKQMLSGPTSLYLYQFPPQTSTLFDVKSFASPQAYIIKKNGQFYTLDNVLKYSELEKKHFVFPRYKGVLLYVFEDCPRLANHISKVNFDDQNILTEVVNYNKCLHPNAVLTLPKYKAKSNWTWGVEFSAATIWKDEEKKDGVGLSGGVFARWFNLGQNENIKASFGINILSVNYKDPLGQSKVFRAVRLPICVNYYLSQNKNKPFIGTGITISDKFLFMNFGCGMEFSGHVFAQAFIEANPIKWDSPRIPSLKLGYIF